MKIDIEDLTSARAEVSDFVRYQAAAARDRVGFWYSPDPLAPGTFEELLDAFCKSTLSHRPLPVSSLHCEGTIYDEPEDNIRFRFWHDTEHVRMGLSFNPADELVVAHQHLSDARDYGMSPSGLAYRLLQADTVANIEASVALGRFPSSGLAFALDCLNEGPEEAIRAQGEHLANQMAIQG